MTKIAVGAGASILQSEITNRVNEDRWSSPSEVAGAAIQGGIGGLIGGKASSKLSVPKQLYKINDNGFFRGRPTPSVFKENTLFRKINEDKLFYKHVSVSNVLRNVGGSGESNANASLASLSNLAASGASNSSLADPRSSKL